jgi:ABC-type phosphate transport system auxiliary subunit
MYHSMMGGSGWFWMTFVTILLIAVLGVVVYIAVRLANRTPTDSKSQS